MTDIEHGKALALSGKYDPASTESTALDGSETGVVLNRVRDWLARFICPMYPRDIDLLTLWIAHTHLVNETYTTPRLLIESPVPRLPCSRRLRVVGLEPEACAASLWSDRRKGSAPVRATQAHGSDLRPGSGHASKHQPTPSKLQQTPLDHATTPANSSKLRRMVTVTTAAMHFCRSGGLLRSQKQIKIKRVVTVPGRGVLVVLLGNRFGFSGFWWGREQFVGWRLSPLDAGKKGDEQR